MEAPPKYNQRHAAEHFDWHTRTDRRHGQATGLYAFPTRNKRLYLEASQMANCMASRTPYCCVRNFWMLYRRICLGSFLGRDSFKASRVQFRIVGSRNAVLRRCACTAYAIRMVSSLSICSFKSSKARRYGIFAEWLMEQTAMVSYSLTKSDSNAN